MSPAAFEPICKVWLPRLFVNFKAFVIWEIFRCFVLWAMFAFFVGLNLQPHVDNNGYFIGGDASVNRARPAAAEAMLDTKPSYIRLTNIVTMFGPPLAILPSGFFPQDIPGFSASTKNDMLRKRVRLTRPPCASP